MLFASILSVETTGLWLHRTKIASVLMIERWRFFVDEKQQICYYHGTVGGVYMCQTDIENLQTELIQTIINLRKERGLSQAQLAEKCDLKQAAIARIELGKNSPQVSTLLKILIPLGYKLTIIPIDG